MKEKDAAQRTTHHQGLSAEKVLESRRAHGANVLTPPARDPWWKLFLEKFDDPVIRILMVAAAVSIVVGIFENKLAEPSGIIAAILLATVLAFVNEFKAGKEFDLLNKVSDDDPVKVVRGVEYTTVPRRDVVVGDLVLVDPGDEIPADGRVLESVDLRVNESSLTGESEAVAKSPHATVREGEDQPAYPLNSLCRGTTVSEGRGVFEVTAVGDSTEIGKTARAAKEMTGEVTPLNEQLEELSKQIGVVGFGFAALTMGALVVRGVYTDAFVLSAGQWYALVVLSAGALIALLPVWLPILYDGLDWAGLQASRPGWLEDDDEGDGDKEGEKKPGKREADDKGSNGLRVWGSTLGGGALVAATGVGAGIALGWMSASPATWVPGHVGSALLTYFMIAVTIIVVAVPEGLAMSVTLSLAYSMRKMMAQNNLVRKMHACETIGAATVICSDKTGTLTMNEMHVDEAHFPVLGGVAPDKDFGSHGHRLVVDAISANTTANVEHRADGSARAIGNPTEGALLLWLRKHGIDYHTHRTAFRQSEQMPFSTERKYMATRGVSPHGEIEVVHVKGAPEIVLETCTGVLTPEGVGSIDSSREEILESLRIFQARGMRTLGFAFRHRQEGDATGFKGQDRMPDLTWLGFVSIADPVREDVPNAVQLCLRAGIQIKMVTGDNPHTAKEIARQIGLIEGSGGAGENLTGPDFVALNDEQAGEGVDNLRVLSRARPMDKMRLVKLLQARNHVVAVTGDGVNDAPALNYAQVGLAMGKTGTAVAKEASDIILLDDSFQSIVNAIMWGRSLYENIQRFILFQLTINVAALGIALLGPFIGVELPLTVTQMLWVNLIMDTFAALALATEPPHESIMERPPRDRNAHIVTPAMAKNIFSVGVLFLGVLAAFLIYLKYYDGDDMTTKDLTVFFSVFVMLQFWNLFNARCLGRNDSAFKGFFENTGFVIIAASIFVGQILFVQIGGEFFRTVPLSLKEWVYIAGGTSVVLWFGEIVRLMRRVRSQA